MSQDWTTGAAKWAAIFVLGTLSGAGVVWSFVNPSAPAVIVRAPDAAPAAEPRSPTRPIAQAEPTSRLLPAPEPPPQSEPATMAPAPLPSAPEAGPAASLVRSININTASAAELEILPGVGPVLAARIIEHRTKIGAFRTVEQLDEVKGIGPKSLEKLRPHVRVQ